MDRINKILFHPEYTRHLQIIRENEKTREYCGHDLEHFLDVARLAWIYCLENKLEYSREIVYAMALLHDIGRSLQYSDGIEHDEASVQLSCEILPECGYSEWEISVITAAIGGHRQSKSGFDDDSKEVVEKTEKTELGIVLYLADHKSRKCFCCPAESTCYWPKEKKNLNIER